MRVRPSTVATTAIFIVTLVLYFLLRPAPTVARVNPSTPSPSTAPRTTTTRPPPRPSTTAVTSPPTTTTVPETTTVAATSTTGASTTTSTTG